jgi:hypothetical protein
VVVVAAVIVVSGLGALGCDCCDSAQTLSRESDLKVTLELQINDMLYSDVMIMHNLQVTSLLEG